MEEENKSESAIPTNKSYASTYLDTEVYDTATRILNIEDELSKDIIFDNISDIIDEKTPTNTRINYVTNFKEKYLRLANGAGDDELAAMKDDVAELASLVNDGLRKKYAVCTGDDLSIVSTEDTLDHLETLYEFFFVRNYQNLLDYFRSKLEEREDEFIDRYKTISQSSEYVDDLFMQQDKKKFKNYDLAILIHFMPEMVDDIKSNIDSGTDLFHQIANMDMYEEYNSRLLELLDNYGSGIAIVDDQDAADLYLSVLNDPSAFSNFKNDLRMVILDDLSIAG
jgi:hypothetical protein